MLLDLSSASPGSSLAGAFPSAAIFMISGALVFLFTLLGAVFTLFSKKVQLLTEQAVEREKGIAGLAKEFDAQARLVRQMMAELEELRRHVSDRQESVHSVMPIWASADMPVNLNRRGQIIRLSRKGKSIPEIAQDLNVAQGEVELLLKVHDLSQKSEQGKS